MIRRLSIAAPAFLVAALAAPVLAQHTDSRVAAQMYTFRQFGPLEEQLKAVADAGITAIETRVDQGVTAEELNRLLDAHGIEVISSHVTLDSLRSDMDSVIAFNKAIGNDTITVPNVPKATRPTDAAGWKALGEELAGLAKALAANGMRLAYHNHAFEMVEYDDRTGLEILFEAAGPGVLAEIDVAWVDRGGQDPAEYLLTIGERVFAIHAKDNAPDGESKDQGGFAEVGSGTLDWDAILEAAADVGVEWYIIEHDKPLDAAQSVATSAEFLNERLGSPKAGE
jgi:sugar phosphate isomerase/epimerase